MRSQSPCLPIHALSNDDVVLAEIFEPYQRNNYFFSTVLVDDSCFLQIPKKLPKGYYEAYYNADTNQLALVYYSNGVHSYGQQFYKDGSMKSDSEYNKYGDLHGLHVLYHKSGEELWHAEYYFGALEPKYNLKYLQEENYTAQALKNQKGFGVYVFEPTPSRARREKIILSDNHRFIYQNSLNFNHYCNQYEGTWQFDNTYLVLQLDQSAVWFSNPKRFAIVQQSYGLMLLEVKDWGVEWYNSEFIKLNKK